MTTISSPAANRPVPRLLRGGVLGIFLALASAAAALRAGAFSSDSSPETFGAALVGLSAVGVLVMVGSLAALWRYGGIYESSSRRSATPIAVFGATSSVQLTALALASFFSLQPQALVFSGILGWVFAAYALDTLSFRAFASALPAVPAFAPDTTRDPAPSDVPTVATPAP